MQRCPEPELMDDAEQAKAYAQADFSEPHNRFIELFLEKFPTTQADGPVLDLGCGPADISIRFARQFPRARLIAIDGAAAMLEQAQAATRETKYAERISLVQACLPLDTLPEHHYVALLSNSLLHHLQDPAILWDTIKHYAKPDTCIFVMDLLRPETKHMAQTLVEQYAADETEILRHDFYHSLCAAYTTQEVKQQLNQCGMSELVTKVVTDRHFIVYGHLN